jgi:hypothetical protein
LQPNPRYIAGLPVATTLVIAEDANGNAEALLQLKTEFGLKISLK